MKTRTIEYKKGVLKMVSEEWVTETQTRELARAYGASPDEIEREIARDYRGVAWYWSPEQRALVSVYDGQTTVADLSDAMARGPLDERHEAMAADFWVMAAQHANTTAAKAQATASARADTEGTTQSLAAFLAADDAAGVTGQVLSDLQGRAEELNRVADAVADERVADHVAHTTATIEVYEVLVDRAYADSVDNNTGRQDDYLDQTWQLAAELAGSGHTAADVKRMELARLADEVSFERAMIAAGEPPASWYLDRAWETAVGVEQDEANSKTGYDNLGLPEVWEVQRTAAVDFIARETGVPTGFVHEQVSHAVAENAVEAPNWHDMTDWYATAETFDGPDAGEVGVEEVTDERQLTVDDDTVLRADESVPVVVTETGEAELLTAEWDAQAEQMRADFEALTPAEHLAAAAAADSLAEELGDLADRIEAGLVDDPASEAARAEAAVAAYWAAHPPVATSVYEWTETVAHKAALATQGAADPEPTAPAARATECTMGLEDLVGADVAGTNRAGINRAEIDRLEAELGATRQDLAEGRVRAEDEHHVAQQIEHLQESLAMAVGQWPFGSDEAQENAGSCSAVAQTRYDNAVTAAGRIYSSQELADRDAWMAAQGMGPELAGGDQAAAGASIGGSAPVDDEGLGNDPPEGVEVSFDEVFGAQERVDGDTLAAGADEYPQEYSVADPDESGPVPPEFVTGQDTSSVEESYPAPWDAYRSGRPDEDAGTRRGGEWEWAYPYTDTESQVGGESPGRSRVAEAAVAAAHAAVEADSQRVAEELGEQDPAPYAGGRAAQADAAEQAPVMEWGA
jgi:hypothetical protein